MSFDKDNIIAHASGLQHQAAQPDANVWVNASAGTGKTTVLTNRVLRLLLPVDGVHDGTDPQNILCITFTKAGANEMITRVMRVLSQWAVCSEIELVDTLSVLLQAEPTLNQVDRARKLFAVIIDTPGGLNITTIHAFCQSILGRFTIEANLPPQFKVMEESESNQLIRNARDSFINDVLDGKVDDVTRDAFYFLSQEKSADQMAKLLQSVMNDRANITKYLSNHNGMTIDHLLGVDADITEDDLFQLYFGDENFPADVMCLLAQSMEHGTAADAKKAADIYNFCAASIDEKQRLYASYYSVFITDKGTVKKVTKDTIKHNPQSFDWFNDEGNRLLMYQDTLNSVKIRHATNALLTLSRQVIERYGALKILQKKLDYDDLIHKTKELLKSEIKDWVLFKLDYGIDHILVDEAQDTSPEQWDIITSLVNEFFTGESASPTEQERTVFVVGDNKQSIFRFQGADPKIFNDVKSLYETMVNNAKKQWRDIPMNTSFRSNSAVLDMVDGVFSTPDLQQSLTQQADAYKAHTAARTGHAGRIECWPLYKAKKTQDRMPWTLPVKIIETDDARSALAERIALSVKEMIDNQVIVPSKKRAVHAGDIMILVRNRNFITNNLIRAFRKYNVPVSGADRLVVSSHIAVLDIMAALSFAIMPDDDLTLACVLKSPLVGWGDAQIEDYAHGREGTLWHAVKSSDTKAAKWLSSLIETISGQNAFAALSSILNGASARDNLNGWASFMARLGDDCIDPLEELLSMAQNYDANQPQGGIQGFIHYIQNNKSNIKREMEGDNGKVRIMTVHASKGLQAPIVICPDTVSDLRASGTSDDGFLWIEDTPIWITSTGIQNDLVTQHRELMNAADYDEYYRLLYVAMTRAEDRLILCGALNANRNKAGEKTWYSIIAHGMRHLNAVEVEWPHDADLMNAEDGASLLVYETSQDIAIEIKDSTKAEIETLVLPPWIINPFAVEQYPPRILKPSQDDADVVPVRSPLVQNDDSYRFRRGLLTHSLLQYLPDLPMDKRQDAGRRYLDKQASGMSQDIKDGILSESIAILSHPEFAPFFGKGSLAEVPVTGMVTHDNGKIDIISGQIDRLLVTDATVWIVDFKSNRPPPKDSANIPPAYRKQLSAYKTLMANIYPNHDIRCALLWTDGPFMSELKDV